MSLKGTVYTKIKKTMTKKMYELYYNENKEVTLSKEEEETAKAEKTAVWERLDGLRLGPHGEKRHEAKMNQIAKFKEAAGGADDE